MSINYCRIFVMKRRIYAFIPVCGPEVFYDDSRRQKTDRQILLTSGNLALPIGILFKMDFLFGKRCLVFDWLASLTSYLFLIGSLKLLSCPNGFFWPVNSCFLFLFYFSGSESCWNFLVSVVTKNNTT